METGVDRAGWMVWVIYILVGVTLLSHVVSTQLDRPDLHVLSRVLALLCFGYTILVVLGFLTLLMFVGLMITVPRVGVFVKDTALSLLPAKWRKPPG